jgi:hypothetical protein
LATRVFDQALITELVHGQRHRWALHTDHLGEELLGHFEGRLLHTFIDLQQPTRRALVETVAPIAEDQLGHADHHHLGVTLQEVDEEAAALELRSELGGRQSHPGQRYLHHGSHRHLTSAEEHRQARHPLASDHGRVDRLTIHPDGHQRSDAARGEVHELDFGIRCIELSRTRKDDVLEIQFETTLLIRGQ